MGKFTKNVVGLLSALNVQFDGTVSGSSATNTQAALDEVYALVNSGTTLIAVETFADLPAANSLPVNSLRLVRTASGVYFINRKQSGLYKTDGANWIYVGTVDLSAASVAYDNTTSGLTATNAQSAIDELEGMVGGGVTTFEGRSGAVVSASGDYTASEITNVPAGNISGTTLQAAVNELDTEKSSKAENFMYALIFG